LTLMRNKGPEVHTEIHTIVRRTLTRRILSRGKKIVLGIISHAILARHRSNPACKKACQ
jgi:hypothetical protein